MSCEMCAAYRKRLADLESTLKLSDAAAHQHRWDLRDALTRAEAAERRALAAQKRADAVTQQAIDVVARAKHATAEAAVRAAGRRAEGAVYAEARRQGKLK